MGSFWGSRVESVLLHRQRKTPELKSSRLTLCISSQAGCAMACAFCLTGRQGLTRHLTRNEILEQVQTLEKRYPITNLVFMGMGEPLHNFDSVTKAIEALLKRPHRPFSRRKIMISTSGLVPQIKRLAQRTPVRLAVSLNASNDPTRSELMPVNHNGPLRNFLQRQKSMRKRSRCP